MLFSVPITGKETIVDTPLNCRSIRSFYFFDRYGKTKWFNGDLYFRGSVSISIDGKRVCDHLWILPFLDRQEDNEVAVSKDWRRISIPCLKNTEMSEIKIETNDACLDYEVVFEYSETEVELEHFYHIESYPFVLWPVSSELPKDLQPYSAKLAHLGEEVQLSAHEEADMIFLNQTVLYQSKNYQKMQSKEEYRYEYAIRYYYSHGSFPSVCPIPSYKLTISDTGDVMPKMMPIDLISADGDCSWKDALYKLNEGLSKHPKLTFDGEAWTSPSEAVSTMIETIYLIHDCNF